MKRVARGHGVLQAHGIRDVNCAALGVLEAARIGKYQAPTRNITNLNRLCHRITCMTDLELSIRIDFVDDLLTNEFLNTNGEGDLFENQLLP